MKTTALWIIIVAVLLCGTFLFALYARPKSQAEEIKVYAFDLLDYSWELEHCSYQKNVGAVETKEVVAEKAKELWKERFGDLYDGYERPVSVAYDPKNECWLVNGTSPHDDNINVETAVPCVLIKKDGTVLALWF